MNHPQPAVYRGGPRDARHDEFEGGLPDIVKHPSDAGDYERSTDVVDGRTVYVWRPRPSTGSSH
jgi:hypothetical protein